MAIAKVVYKESSTATPSTWMDVTQKTVTSATMLSSITALKNDGTNITGTIATKSVVNLWFSSSTATFGVPTGYYSGTGAIYWTIASKGAETFVPAETAQTISSYQWLTGSQTIAAISSTYVGTGVPTIGATTIYPSTSAQVAVSSGTYTTGDITVGAVALQSKTVTPTESSQTVTPDSGTAHEVSPDKATQLSSNPLVTTIDLSFIEYGKKYRVTGNITYTTNYRESANIVAFDTIWTASEDGDIDFSKVSGTSENATRITLSKTQLKVYLPDGTTISRGDIANGSAYYNTITFTSIEDSYIGLSSVLVNGISSTYIGTGVTGKQAGIFYTSTADQTIASGQYLYGTQTFLSVTALNLEASYISSGITVKIGDRANASRIANVTGTLQGAESFAAIYKSLAYRSVIASSASYVSEWTNSLTRIESWQFDGQLFSGDFTFGNVSYISNYGFAVAWTGNGFVPNPYYQLTFPSSVFSVATNCFAFNLNCNSIDMPYLSSVPEKMFFSGRLNHFSLPRVGYVATSAFYGCYLREVNLPSCSSIESYAFAYNSRISILSLPLCKNISERAFSYCRDLSQLSLPLCETIGYYAFNYATSLQTVIAPKCSYIGNNAFQECSKLVTVEFPLCENINANAFASCILLGSASFPICSIISQNTFTNCYSLSYVSFPKCNFIGSYAFQRCSMLESIILPECSIIQYGVFISCISLKMISLPACTSISGYAFSACSALESLYFMGSSIASIAGTLFIGTPLQNSSYLGYFGSIYVPSSMVDSYKTATNWTQYSNRIVGI